VPAARPLFHGFDRPVTDGQGKMNAYVSTPTLGPDGYFHMYGVWRDTPDCATNHHLSYARSNDLRHWEKGNGEALETPLTISNIDIVDPTPAGGGLLNGNCKLGFDTKQRPVISYHKYGPKGNSQIFSARLEDGAWRIYQTTDWENFRWDFKGNGSLPGYSVRAGAISRTDDGAFTLRIHSEVGGGNWLIDEATLKAISKAPNKPGTKAIPSYHKVESAFPGMQKRRCASRGDGPNPRVRYALAWETLLQNRDQPREGPLPEPSMLRLHTLIQP